MRVAALPPGTRLADSTESRASLTKFLDGVSVVTSFAGTSTCMCRFLREGSRSNSYMHVPDGSRWDG